MIKTIIKASLACLLLFGVAQAEPFKVRDIVLQGLERISPGTVFTYLPVKVGDTFSSADSAQVIKELYKTELFNDISLGQDGDVLIVVLQERPGIASLNIIGNKDIPDDQLIESLSDIGIAPGRVLNRSVLGRLENELLQQYFSRGKYSVQIKTEMTELSRNRVDIEIQIAEGDAAEIRGVNIVGNQVYKDKELKKSFESGSKPWWKPLSDNEKYSKQRLQADLEKLRSKYLNSGYLNFNVASTQVSISQDKKDIFITVNVDEGNQYTIKEIKLAGTFVVAKEDLEAQLLIATDQFFSRSEVVASAEGIKNRLSEDGYAFARVNPVPDVNEEDKSVVLTFFIDPGKRVYVRRINITGNDYSRDEVYRREFRQMEGGWFSQTAIEISRRRVQRLAFVESVEFETIRIPGADDMVDIEVVVSERLAGSFTIGAGLSDSQGAVITTSLSQDNFLGSGKSVSFSINTSKVNTVYDLSYNDPYYTIDGVNRGYGFSYISVDAEKADISDFNTDELSFRTNYGIPLTEDDRVGATAEISHTKVTTGTDTSEEIYNFLQDNGSKFTNINVSGNITHDTRNRRIFGTEGFYQRARVELAVPMSGLEYYKVDYKNIFLYPLTDIFTLSTRSQVGYGDSYGDTTDLPFFQKYRAGGSSSVRGYRANSLGPRDSKDRAYGGNLLTTAGVELFFPVPALADSKNFRLGLFSDIGNVYADVDEWEASELRGSYGLELNMITGLGGISLSFAGTYNDEPDDKTESFQFEFGTSF